MAAITVSIVNHTTVLADADVRKVTRALRTQLTEHFTPAWGIDAELVVVPRGRVPRPGTWWLVLLDHSDQAGVLGLHDLTDEGMPLAKVFVKTIRDLGRSWTIAASHELIEMLVDPGVNLAACVDTGDGAVFYAYEVCDPCERDDYGYEIEKIRVANFVYPAWFEPFRKPSGSRFDHCRRISCWLQLLPGGYATVFDPKQGGGWNQIHSDGTTPGEQTIARAGSRRFRRRTPRVDWRRSAIGARPAPRRAAGPAIPVKMANPAGGPPSVALKHSNGVHRNVLDEIDEAITRISLSSSRGLAHRDTILSSLRIAREKLCDPALLSGEIPEDPSVSLLMSAIAGTGRPGKAFNAFELAGFDQYGTLDIDWISHYVASLNFPRVSPFPHCANVEDTITQIADDATIAIAGDWGTGLPSSRKIAEQMLAVKPDHTIHLGDVYYAGTPDDVRNNFLNPAGNHWPAGRSADAPSFALNSNHEMYAGGQGYFGVTLCHPDFRAQKRRSFFALENRDWIIIGLDTAYFAPDKLFQLGAIDDECQLPWLRALTARARESGNRKKIILMSHHDGFDVDRRTNEFLAKPLWDQVVNAMGGAGPDYWYWGHIHGAIAYKPVQTPTGIVLPRCVGHGGIPFEPYKTAVGLGGGKVGAEWVENRLAHDNDEVRRAINGFVVVRLKGDSLEEEFRDEDGAVQWRRAQRQA